MINNPDILKSICSSQKKPLITVGFAYETNNYLDNAKKKLENKKNTYNEKLKSILGKLNNKAFIEKAPDNVIENFRIQEQDMKSSIEKINEIINTIN